MPDSASSQSEKPYPELPRELDDADAWGRWAVEFLNRECQEWRSWRGTWTHDDVPVYTLGDPDAFCILERDSRRAGTSRKLVTGTPPPGISRAAPLFEVCSDAVLRFSAPATWKFADQEQADEVADALLTVAQLIQNRSYHDLSQARLEEVSRLVRMATRRRKPTEGTPKGETERVRADADHRKDMTRPSEKKSSKAGGRPSVSEAEAKKRTDLVARWKQAKSSKIGQKDFCIDQGVTLEYLRKCVNWQAQRRRRNGP